MQIFEVRYARSGDVAIAYQVIGSDEGANGTDIVFVRGMSSDLLSTWDVWVREEVHEAAQLAIASFIGWTVFAVD